MWAAFVGMGLAGLGIAGGSLGFVLWWGRTYGDTEARLELTRRREIRRRARAVRVNRERELTDYLEAAAAASLERSPVAVLPPATGEIAVVTVPLVPCPRNIRCVKAARHVGGCRLER